MRDRLIELIKDSLKKHIGKSCLLAENITDDLLASGVIVPPCKVGDKIFFVHDMCDENGKEYVEISNGWCVSFSLDGLWMFVRYEGGLTMWHCIANDLGTTLFLTKEEAEKALKGGAE